MILRRPKTTHYVLFTVCLMYLIFYMDRVNISTAAPVIQKDLHLTAKELGFAFSAFAYPYAFFQIAGGWLGDRWGPRLTLFLCAVFVGIATIWTGLAGGLLSLFCARLALGIGEGPAFPTATRALATWMPTTQRGFAQGITHSFSRFGNFLTPLLVANLILAFSWHAAFLLFGVLALIWAVVWFFYFRDDPRTHGGVDAATLETLPPATVAKVQRDVPWGPLIKRILPVTLTDFCYGWMLWLYLNWIPSFFVHDFHLNLKKTAIFASGVFFAGVIGDTTGGLISDKILRATGNVGTARIGVIVVGFVGSFCCLLPIVFVHDLVTAAVCLSLAFFFAELIVAPIWAVPMDIAPEYSGTASGFMNFGFGMAGIISPVVFGAVIDATGRWDYPFIGSLAILPIGAILALFVRPGARFVDPRVAAASSAPREHKLA